MKQRDRSGTQGQLWHTGSRSDTEGQEWDRSGTVGQLWHTGTVVAHGDRSGTEGQIIPGPLLLELQGGSEFC